MHYQDVSGLISYCNTCENLKKYAASFFINFPGEFSASDTSLTDLHDQRRQAMPDPGLMPLPDAASDMEWSNLVDAAKAFEGKTLTINRQTKPFYVYKPFLACACLEDLQIYALKYTFFTHTILEILNMQCICQCTLCRLRYFMLSYQP